MNDTYIIPIFIAGTLLLTLFAFFLITFLLIQKNKQNRFQMEKEKMIYSYKNEILRTRLEVQEYSMNQISKEIHDNIGQLLGLAQMNMYTISDIPASEKESRLINSTNNLLSEAIEGLRNISHSLNNDLIKQLGLLDMLKKDFENIELSLNIECSIGVEGDYQSFNEEQELLIYRIVQEAMHNIIKHAEASKIDININCKEPNIFVLSVSDNGIGFDTGKAADGIGFINMHQRVAFLNGKLAVDSIPGTGTKIILTINREG